MAKSSFISSAYDKNWDSIIKEDKQEICTINNIWFRRAVNTEDNSRQSKQDNTHLQPDESTSCVPTNKLRKPTPVTTQPINQTNSSVCDVSGALETRTEYLSTVLTSLSTPLAVVTINCYFSSVAQTNTTASVV